MPGTSRRSKRHGLGQHYLVDPEVVERMVSAAGVKKTDSVVEIGTGEGALTRMLAGVCGRLDGYEVDPGNYEKTVARAGGRGVSIHLSDGFLRGEPFDVLVSSLPYSRSLDFVEWISQVEYRRGVVLLQEDFVAKVLSPPGSRDYRGVSAMAQISTKFTRLQGVRREAFSPPPRVNSVMVALTPRLRLSEAEASGIKRLFSLRRREVASALAKLGFGGRGEGYGRRRVYSLSPTEVHEICRQAP